MNLIEARGVSKSFGSTKALVDVSIAAAAGSVHAVTGENGAGKSTLMKLLGGVERPDAGTILVGDKDVRFATPRDALVHGVSTVFQEFTLLPNLSVAENLYLGREPLAAGFLARRTMLAAATDVLERVGIDVDPQALTGGLTIGQQQLVEIAKGVCADASIFIFDEPTAALNAVEVDRLALLLRRLREANKAILYISHRLEEIFRFCDTVTVLKDGRHVATAPTATLDRSQLVTLMVGRPVQELYPQRMAPTTALALDVREFVAVKHAPEVNFVLRRGEILGLAGLEGQGQREIIRSIAGALPPQSGKVYQFSPDGTPLRLNPQHGVTSMVARGVGFVPADRKTEGLYLDLSIFANVSLGCLRGLGLGAIAPGAAGPVAALMERMQLRARNSRQIVRSLSGGNQQKVMLGRWFAAGVDILLIEEPTRGVDIGAKAEIYGLLREFTGGGGAVVMTSSELTEIIGLCDRVLVARGGRLVAEFAAVDASEAALMEHALDVQERSVSA